MPVDEVVSHAVAAESDESAGTYIDSTHAVRTGSPTAALSPDDAPGNRSAFAPRSYPAGMTSDLAK